MQCIVRDHVLLRLLVVRWSYCSNNAGVMMCPFMRTADGHEMQFGTNHLGEGGGEGVRG